MTTMTRTEAANKAMRQAARNKTTEDAGYRLCEGCLTKISLEAYACQQCQGYHDIGSSPMLWD